MRDIGLRALVRNEHRRGGNAVPLTLSEARYRGDRTPQIPEAYRNALAAVRRDSVCNPTHDRQREP
jgi:hypothetical protein